MKGPLVGWVEEELVLARGPMALVGGLVVLSACPALASSRNITAGEGDNGWARLPSFSATVATGVAFSTADEGIVIGGTNNVGPSVSSTADGGASFVPATFEDQPFFLWSGSILREHSVLSSFLTWAWESQDTGRTYRLAEAPLPANLGPQYVSSLVYLGQPTFVLSGDTSFYNGISISFDGGRSFGEAINIFADQTIERTLNARHFAADPSGSTWYVTGGASTNTSSVGNEYYHVGDQFFLRRDALDASSNTSAPILLITQPQKQAPRAAGISKSQDGGETWRVVYESEGEFSFSDISCFDAVRIMRARKPSSV